MAKQKTHKGLSKRVKVTANGKVKARKSFGGHLLSGKNAKRRRRLSGTMLINGASSSRIKVLLGKD